jgi:membrane-associated PAP2 superfamily phosphatase
MERDDHMQAETMMNLSACRRRGWLVLAGLALVLVTVTAVLTAASVDLRVAAQFYDGGRGWFMGNDQPWRWFYQYGTIPGLVVTLAALVGWFAARFRRSLAAWRPYCLLVVLTTVICSGILVNAVLKQYWGRPRPDQVTIFGGQWTYRDVHEPGIPGQGGSFPCGHCAMGFTLVSLFGFHRRSRLLAYAGGGTGLVLGGALSATRIVQGAHFLTDTLWSLGLNLLVAAALYYLVLAIPTGRVRAEKPATTPGRRIGWFAGLAVCLALVVGAFATRRPFYETYTYPVTVPSGIETLVVRINADPERFNVSYHVGGASWVRLDSHGFGWMHFDHRVAFETAQTGRTLVLNYRVNPVSYFAELDHTIDLRIPHHYSKNLDIRLESQSHPATPEKPAS